MDNELKEILKEEILEISNAMRELDATCEDYKVCMGHLTDLLDQYAAIEKIENAAYESEQKRSQEYEFKNTEFEQEYTKQLIKIGEIAATLTVGVLGCVLKGVELKQHAVDMKMRHEEINRITKFEEENNILGIADKAIAQKVPPRDW